MEWDGDWEGSGRADDGQTTYAVRAHVGTGMIPLLYQRLGLPVAERPLTMSEIDYALKQAGLVATFYPQDNLGKEIPGVDVRSVRPMAAAEVDELVGKLGRVAYRISIARQRHGRWIERVAEWGTWTTQELPNTKVSWCDEPPSEHVLRVPWLEAISGQTDKANKMSLLAVNFGRPYTWRLQVEPGLTILPLFDYNGLVSPKAIDRATKLVVCMPWLFRKYGDRYYLDASNALPTNMEERAVVARKAFELLVHGWWDITEVMGSAFRQTQEQLLRAFALQVSFDDARGPNRSPWESNAISTPAPLIDLDSSPLPTFFPSIRSIVFTQDGKQRLQSLLNLASWLSLPTFESDPATRSFDPNEMNVANMGRSIAACVVAALWAALGFRGGPGSNHPLAEAAREALGSELDGTSAWSLAVDVVDALVATLPPNDALAVLNEIQQSMDEHLAVSGSRHKATWRKFDSEPGQALTGGYKRFGDFLSHAMQRARQIGSALDPSGSALLDGLTHGEMPGYQAGRLDQMGSEHDQHMQIAHALAMYAAGRARIDKTISWDVVRGWLDPLIGRTPPERRDDMIARAASTWICAVYKELSFGRIVNPDLAEEIKALAGGSRPLLESAGPGQIPTVGTNEDQRTFE